MKRNVLRSTLDSLKCGCLGPWANTQMPPAEGFLCSSPTFPARVRRSNPDCTDTQPAPDLLRWREPHTLTRCLLRAALRQGDAIPLRDIPSQMQSQSAAHRKSKAGRRLFKAPSKEHSRPPVGSQGRRRPAHSLLCACQGDVSRIHGDTRSQRRMAAEKHCSC